MSYLNIKLKKKLKFRLDLSQLIPDKIGKKTKTEIKTLQISYGNETRNISYFFSISGTLKKGIIFKGDLSKCDYIGNQMKNGEIIINGNTGNYLGNKMKNGKIIVNGSTSDYAGCSLQGGEIIIKKNTGDYLGSSQQGNKIGMSGGILLVYGNAGIRVGFKMRSGVIYIKGNVKDFLGNQMIAGTIITKGKIGSNIGLLMKRGTIVIKDQKFLAPHFNYNGTNKYIFLKIMEFYLEKISKEFKNIFPSIYTKKYLGDINCKGMGEILVIS